MELATQDSSAAKRFYADLFDWTIGEYPISDGEVYVIFRKGDRDAGAMFERKDVPSSWQSYVAVSNVDAAVEKATSLGATIVAPAMDVFDAGRMAVLSDPQGASFALWQADKHVGLTVRDEANSLCWNELQANDVDTAKRFYVALFGWRTKESNEYTEFHLGENAIGGLMQKQGPPDAPPFWLPYFAVDDCDAMTAKAGSLGATVHVPPMDIPNVGRFSVLVDPTGAAFAMIKLGS
jgi:predicted enzyme related to lactoylglutathione lyase